MAEEDLAQDYGPSIEPPHTYSFAAAGWLQMYHFGVGKAMQDCLVSACSVHGQSSTNVDSSSRSFTNDDAAVLPSNKEQQQPQLKGEEEPTPTRYAGTSAGGLCALALSCGVNFDDMREYAVDCSRHCRAKWYRAFLLRRYVTEGITKFAKAVLCEDPTAAMPASPVLPTSPQSAAASCSTPATGGKKPTSTAFPTSTSASGNTTTKATFPTEKTTEEKWQDEFDEVIEAAENRIEQATQFHDDQLPDALQSIKLAPRMTEKLSKTLEVYATVLPSLKEKRFTVFHTLAELEEALLASCCLVPLCGLPFRLKSTREWVVDGGVVAFQPRKGEKGVVTVSPVYSDSADIHPSVFVPVWWGFYPPNEEQYRALYDLGYNDAVDYFVREGFLPPSALGALLRHKEKEHVSRGKDLPKQTAASLFWDLFTFFSFLCFLRPISLFFVYGEMAMVAMATIILAMLHDVLPLVFPVLSYMAGSRAERRKEGSRRAAWRDVYNALRNLFSLRVAFHVLFGSKIPANTQRLEKYSRIYRIVRPFVGK